MNSQYIREQLQTVQLLKMRFDDVAHLERHMAELEVRDTIRSSRKVVMPAAELVARSPRFFFFLSKNDSPDMPDEVRPLFWLAFVTGLQVVRS